MRTLGRSEVRAAVLQALGKRLELLDLGAEEIGNDFDLFGSGVLDSLGFVDLLLTVEERLGRQFSLEDLDFEDLQTLGALVVQLTRLPIQDTRDVI